MELKLYSPPILLDVVVFLNRLIDVDEVEKRVELDMGQVGSKLSIRITRQSFSGRPSSHTQM